MDAIEKLSGQFVKQLLPLIKQEAEIAYVVTMVLMSVMNTDKSWHKKNLFLSYLRALFYVKGAEMVLNLCTGRSPMTALSSNNALLLVALVWWLVLFVPFDIFNKILEFEVGDLKPVILLINLLTIVRQVTAVDAAVTYSLSKYPGSYIAIFVGTLAGNGCLVVAPVFGDFARAITNERMTTTAFVTALLITLSKLLCPKTFSAIVVLTFAALLHLMLQLLAAFNMKIELFGPLYQLVETVVVTCDLVDPN